MHGHYLAKIADAEKFWYSKLKEFSSCFCSTKRRRTEYSQLHYSCFSDNGCGNSSKTAIEPNKPGGILSSLYV